MKKISILLVAVLAIIFAGCGKDKNITYYPDDTEMKENLEEKGYTVSVKDDFDDKYKGTHLSASKDKEYIEVYWLDDGKAADYYSKLLEKKHTDFFKSVSMAGDEKFGTIVFCATKSGLDASGINIADVKVKVDY